MKRLLVRFLVTAASLVMIAAFPVYYLLSRSLPQLDGEVLIDGVKEDVIVERDASGIPVIIASNRPDLAYGTGYVHGQDRFFQMDLTRRNAAGELSELFGPDALPVDRRHRFHRFRDRANTVLSNLSDREREILEAYTAGVNAGLSSLGAKPFEYFLTENEPRPWEAADSLLVVYTMYIELNDERANRDVRRGLVHRILPQEVFDWLYPQGTTWDAPMLGDPAIESPAPGIEQYNLNGTATGQARISNPEDSEPLLPGSNNWAIAGSLTDSGGAIVANDMHLGITTPNVFYRTRLRTIDMAALDLNGVTLPGAPILVAGSNGWIAWGNTNSYGDWTDAVIVVPGSQPDTYLTPEGPKTFTVHTESIAVKGAEPEPYEIRETIWGPVLDDNPDPEQQIAVSWIAHHVEGVTLGHLDLETVTSVEDAMSVANTIGMPPQNFVVGDSQGNIGWTIAGSIPRRADFDPLLPADWSQSGGWIGWVPPAEYPRVLNPASGRIWTANARVVDSDGLAIIGDGGYDLGARARQIRDGLFAKERFAPEDMLGVQLDDRAVFLSRWRDLLLATLDNEATAGNAERGAYRALAQGWIPRAIPDSVGYRLVRAFRSEVRGRVFTMMMQPVLEVYGEDTELRISNQFESPLWALVTERPAHLLTDNYESWNELLLQSIDSNIGYFAENFAGGLDQRTWGERNTARIQHPLSRALPFLAHWLDMPADALPGDSNLPRAQGPSFGASERFAVTPGSEQNGYLHMPAGQSGHPLSAFYRVGHEDWVQGRPSAFLPGDAVHTLTLKAAD
jgi:penicillin amidase